MVGLLISIIAFVISITALGYSCYNLGYQRGRLSAITEVNDLFNKNRQALLNTMKNIPWIK